MPYLIYQIEYTLQLWNSGTTVTICLIHGNYIYTCWVGDSQVVLFNTSTPTTRSTPSHQSSGKPTARKEEPIHPVESPAQPSLTLKSTTEIPHIDALPISQQQHHKSGKKQSPPQPLNMESIEPTLTASSAPLTSPISPRTRAARWGFSFSWFNSLVRGGSGGGGSISSKESSPSEAPHSQPRMRAPLATQEVEEAELVDPETPPESPSDPIAVVEPTPSIVRVPFRYGSLPVGKKKDRQIYHQHQIKGVGSGAASGGSSVSATVKRLSAHFSEPSLNVVAAPVSTVDTTTTALSAGHRISPAGDMRDSRSTSMVEKSLSDSMMPSFKILTPHLHRPEYPVSSYCLLVN